MSDLRLVIAGCGGRMGRALIEAVTGTPGVVLAGALERAESPLVGQDAGLPPGLRPPASASATMSMRPSPKRMP